MRMSVDSAPPGSGPGALTVRCRSDAHSDIGSDHDDVPVTSPDEKLAGDRDQPQWFRPVAGHRSGARTLIMTRMTCQGLPETSQRPGARTLTSQTQSHESGPQGGSGRRAREMPAERPSSAAPSGRPGPSSLRGGGRVDATCNLARAAPMCGYCWPGALLSLPAVGRDRTGPDGHADFCFFVLRHIPLRDCRGCPSPPRAVSIDRDFTLSSFKITDRSGMNVFWQQLSFYYTGTEIGDEH